MQFVYNDIIQNVCLCILKVEVFSYEVYEIKDLSVFFRIVFNGKVLDFNDLFVVLISRVIVRIIIDFDQFCLRDLV